MAAADDSSVWPDCAILKVLGDMVSIKRSPNAWWIFGLKWTATFLMLNYCDYFLGNFWNNLGYFLIYHLVALSAANLLICFCCFKHLNFILNRLLSTNFEGAAKVRTRLDKKCKKITTHSLLIPTNFADYIFLLITYCTSIRLCCIFVQNSKCCILANMTDSFCIFTAAVKITTPCFPFRR